jgi:hypothetical protein
LARPILEYGDALWSVCLSEANLKVLEDVQTRFARRLLTVSRHAPAVFVRSELGIQSMKSRGLHAGLKFFGKLVRMLRLSPNRLAAFIFRLRCDQVDGLDYDDFDSSTHRLGHYSWCRSMKEWLEANGCTDHWRHRFVPQNWGAVAKSLVNRHEVQLVNREFAAKTTLQLYQSLPRSGAPEKWMDRSLNHPGVRIKVLMRSNCAPVYERVGARRAYGIPRQARICKFCGLNAVESVAHVVSTCPCYDDLRRTCLQRLDDYLKNENVSEELAAKLADRSEPGLTMLFLGDVFRGLPTAVYNKAHGILVNFLMLLWRRRVPLWARFCSPDKEWQLRNPPAG